MPFRVEPFAVFDEFVIRDRAIAETRRRRAFEGAIGQRHVRFADRKRGWSGQRSFRGFDVREEVVIRQKVPGRVRTLAVDREHAEQSEAALELKN